MTGCPCNQVKDCALATRSGMEGEKKEEKRERKGESQLLLRRMKTVCHVLGLYLMCRLLLSRLFACLCLTPTHPHSRVSLARLQQGRQNEEACGMEKKRSRQRDKRAEALVKARTGQKKQSCSSFCVV